MDKKITLKPFVNDYNFYQYIFHPISPNFLDPYYSHYEVLDSGFETKEVEINVEVSNIINPEVKVEKNIS